MSSGKAAATVEQGRKPNKTIHVPREHRVYTLERESDLLAHEVLAKTGCVLIPYGDHGRINKFEIYGAAVDAASVLINKWISNAHVKSAFASAWARTPAFNVNDWYYGQVAEMETDRKQMFKGPAPQLTEDAPKPPSVVVDWPEDLRILMMSPRDAFGHKLEALNDLRMRDEVFITLLPNHNGLSQVEIVGFDAGNVEKGAAHYKTLIEKVRTETLGLLHGVNLILDDAEGIKVLLAEAEAWWPDRSDKVVPRLVRSHMMFPEGKSRGLGMESEKLVLIQRSVEQALEAIRRKRGCYDFAVHLGSLALDSKNLPTDQIGKTFEKQDFLKIIDSRVDIIVKKWAFNEELGRKVLRRLIAADDLLEPTRPAAYFGYLPQSLEQTRPMFRGTWVFKDPNASVSQPSRRAGRPALPQQASSAAPAGTAPPSSLLIVKIDWVEDEDGLYEKVVQFYKSAAENMAPKVNMDVNLLELGEGRGWSFALESMIPVSSNLVSPALVDFSKKVCMQAKYDIGSNDSFASWGLTATIKKHLVNYRMDKIYSFGIRRTCYKVEHAAMWYSKEQQAPVWGLAIRHMAWETHLAELERLPVGEQAGWNDIIATFFPDDGLMSTVDLDSGKSQVHVEGDEIKERPRHGIRILVRKMLLISAIVSSITGAAAGGDSIEN